MLLQSAKDILKNHQTDEVLRLLGELVENETEFSSSFYNLVISEKKIISNNVFSSKFYKYLFKTKAYEKIYELLFSKRIADINYPEMEIILITLEEMGRVSDFHLKSKKITEHLLLNKLYPSYEKFKLQYGKKLSSQNFFLVAEILYNTDIGNIKEIVNLYEKILEGLFQQKLNDDLFTIVLELLLQINVQDYRIEKIKCTFGFVAGIKNKKVLSKEIFTEALLFAQNKNDYLLILELCTDDKVADNLWKYIRQNYKVTANTIPPILTNVKNRMESSLLITKTKIETVDDLEYPEEKFNKLPKEKKYKPSEKGDYQIEVEEKNLIKHFEYDTRKELLSSDLVVSFINLEFFSLAKNLTLKLPNSTNKYYLLATIQLEMNNYSECIYTVNKCLTDYKITDQQCPPFEYLKATAFEQLLDFSASRACHKRIVAVDPTFKDSKEKLLK